MHTFRPHFDGEVPHLIVLRKIESSNDVMADHSSWLNIASESCFLKLHLRAKITKSNQQIRMVLGWHTVAATGCGFAVVVVDCWPGNDRTMPLSWTVMKACYSYHYSRYHPCSWMSFQIFPMVDFNNTPVSQTCSMTTSRIVNYCGSFLKLTFSFDLGTHHQAPHLISVLGWRSDHKQNRWAPRWPDPHRWDCHTFVWEKMKQVKKSDKFYQVLEYLLMA